MSIHRIILFGVALASTACATASDMKMVKARVTLLESRHSEAEERNRTALAESASRAATEDKALRRDLASVGAREDALSQRVLILEGRTEEVQTSQGKVNVNAERLADISEEQLKTKELVAQLDQRMAAMEKLLTSGAVPVPSSSSRTREPIDEEAVYKAALSAHNNGDYKIAQDGFEKLLREAPDSKYASNAQFWLGEGSYKQKKFDDALKRYSTVVEKYPDSQKLCASMYKLGSTLELMGEKQKAKTFFSEVEKRCPDTPEAKEAAKHK